MLGTMICATRIYGTKACGLAVRATAFRFKSSRRSKPTDGHATVHHEHLSEDVAGFARPQPTRSGGDLTRPPATLARNFPLHVLSKGRVLGTICHQHRSE